MTETPKYTIASLIEWLSPDLETREACEAELSAMRAENARLRKALERYADDTSWTRIEAPPSSPAEPEQKGE